MQKEPVQSSPQKQQQLLQPIISPSATETQEDEQFVVIEYEQQQQPITQFLDADEIDIKIKVIDYIFQKSYVVLSTQTFIIKIFEKQNQQKIQLQQSRNISDFQWLKRTIQLKYPGIGIPVYSIGGSVQNLTKQKIIVVQQFLNYLIEHSILKYSPEVKAFLSQKIKYLEMRKQIQLSFSEYIKHRNGFELSYILSSLKAWKKMKPADDESLNISHIKQIQTKEAYFKKTVTQLQKLMKYNRRCDDLVTSLISSQKQTFSRTLCIQQFQQHKQTIKTLYIQNQQKKQSEQSLEYLDLGIKIQMVKQNLLNYLEWFNKIRKIQQTTLMFKENQDYNKYILELNYLRLLVNNMMRDMAGWTEYNNNLVLDSFYQV